jgi:cell wall-associated NlpC family hydrolase
VSLPAFVVSGPRARVATAVFGPRLVQPTRVGLGEAPRRASSPATRKARPAPVVRKVRPARVRVAEVVTERTERARVRPASRSATRATRSTRTTAHRVKARPVVRKVARKAPAARRGMGAVVAFARSKVGARYGTSAGRYDCSKLVQAAYAQAGIRLPRQSGAIAARARTISWAAARPGDLIVGDGHVAVYMGKRGGRHMMIDAGNSRVGVTYRPVYFNSQGLHPERVG